MAVCYQLENKTIISHFAEAHALLPVQAKHLPKLILLPWGRRQNERGQLPLGGWASLESLKRGEWDHYFPKRVRLAVHKFMEQDFESQLHWFDITAGQWIEGLYVQEKEERRVYIITLTPTLSKATYSRWPNILSDNMIL